METKHTPGKWKIEDPKWQKDHIKGNVKILTIVPDDGYGAHLAGVYGSTSGLYDSYIGVSEMRANAILIAAAPDLLEALEKIVAGLAEFDSNPRIYGEEVKKARAAIAKAKGDK